jgi:hypothetical protein
MTDLKPGGTTPDGQGREDPLTVPWYAQPDDLIGGWCVMLTDDPPSAGGIQVADFCHEGAARHVAELHNGWLESHHTHSSDLDADTCEICFPEHPACRKPHIVHLVGENDGQAACLADDGHPGWGTTARITRYQMCVTCKAPECNPALPAAASSGEGNAHA